ncbi:hypothetical protein GA0074695_3840 [Micromonospora viridifaciens]|uniref:Uncharacterized protein n=1 Tax=Micromonospora viridifaciens TaxID=1881 RepID=A0A1C4Y537_MICVI|nr:hypothetical protein [Micromonospora viridifaciens]SCF15491.1 hypothetical protein GA0074695_3840 [Micromonospora viridifaciens]
MTLERAYRWLLACYPREHRQQYADEMLGVLLDDAAPGQRRPRAREVRDLLDGALRTHVRYGAARLSERTWRDAASALGLIAALALLAYAARLPVLHLALLAAGQPGGLGDAPPWQAWLSPVAWLAVAVLAGLAWRRSAAVLAGAAAALEVARAAGEYAAYLSVFNLWPAVLAGMAAAALAVPAARSGAAVIGRWRLGALAAATLLGGSAPAFAAVALPGPGSESVRTSWIFTTSVDRAEALLLGAGYALCALVVLSTPAALRRRLLALLVPVGAALLLTRAGVGVLHRPLHDGIPAALTPAQLLAVALLPGLAFAAAVVALHRRERRARLLAIEGPGERRSPDDPRPSR